MTMQGHCTLTTFVLLSACGAANAVAQGTPPADSTQVLPLETLVVAATRTNQQVGAVPANVTVLGHEEIRLSAARSVPDLLRSIPGLTFADYQSNVAGHPARQSPAMRGLGGTTSSRALVLVDGVPMDDPFTGWVAWARIPLALVERIEIVRGGGAGIWGSRAMGGVINIITVRPVANRTTLSVRGGSQATAAANGSVMRVHGPLSFAAAAEHANTDGFYVVPESRRGPIDIPAGTRHTAAFARLRYDAAPALSLYLNGDWFDEYRRNATQLGRVNTQVGKVHAGAQLRTGANHWSIDAYSVTKSGDNFTTSDSDDRLTETPIIDQFESPANALGLNMQWSRPLGTAHELSIGSDVLLSDGELREHVRYVGGEFTRERRAAGEQLNRSLYVQDVLTPSSAWRVLVAARLDRWTNRDGERGEIDLATGNQLVDSSYVARSESHLSYTLAVRHQASDAAALRSSVYTSFRAPTLNELYRPARASGGIVLEPDPTLEAELLTGAEAGIDYNAGASVLLRATAFWSQLDNPIVDNTIEEAGPTGRVIPPCGFVSANGTCRQRRNLGASRSYGVETEVELRPDPRWLLGVSYTWNPTEVTEAPGQEELVGNEILGQATHTLSGRVRWADPRIADLSLNARYVGSRYDDDRNTLELESFVTVDVRAARHLNRYLQLFASVENVFDAEYKVNRAPDGSYRISGPRRFEAGARAQW